MSRRSGDNYTGARWLFSRKRKRSPELRAALDAAMTEDDLLLAIMEAAQLLGWLVWHVRRSDLALQMGIAGFPDLVLAKAGRVLFLELKAERGIVTTQQLRWLRELGDVARIVYPRDLDEILETLK